MEYHSLVICSLFGVLVRDFHEDMKPWEVRMDVPVMEALKGLDPYSYLIVSNRPQWLECRSQSVYKGIVEYASACLSEYTGKRVDAVFSFDGKYGKPSDAMFKYAMGYYGNMNIRVCADDCLMVAGDNVDEVFAANTGIECVHVNELLGNHGEDNSNV